MFKIIQILLPHESCTDMEKGQCPQSIMNAYNTLLWFLVFSGVILEFFYWRVAKSTDAIYTASSETETVDVQSWLPSTILILLPAELLMSEILLQVITKGSWKGHYTVPIADCSLTS
jgi:hypothetical protein